MSEIKFNCPQCGQHLTVAASGANATVACPQCGQAILVPQLARVDSSGTPSRVKRRLLLVGCIVIGLLVAGLVVWLTLWRNMAPTNSANALTGEKSLNEGLVLHLTFDRDETADGLVTDSSSGGNNGIPLGVRWTPDGKLGGAYKFTKDGDRIVVQNNASLNPAHLTVSAWIKTTTADSVWRRIFDKSYTQGFDLTIAGDYKNGDWRGLGSMELGPGPPFMLSKTRLADGQWHQVVGTFDGTNEALYVDGRLEATLRWKRSNRVRANVFNLLIGCIYPDGTGTYVGKSFGGIIDEPMMWNRALSKKEVAYLFELQNGAPAGQSKAN